MNHGVMCRVWSILDTTLMSIIRQCPLELLRCEGCKLLTDVALYDIPSHRPLLCVLDIGWCDKISNSVLTNLTQACPRLSAVNYYQETFTSKRPIS